MQTMYQFKVTFRTALFVTSRHFWLAKREDGQALREALAARFPGTDFVVEFQTIEYVLPVDMAVGEIGDELDAHASVALGQ